MPESAQSNPYTSSPEGSSKVYSSNPGTIFGISTRTITIALVGLGLVAGAFFAGASYQSKQGSVPTKDLPLTPEILTSAVMTGWRGSASGKVVSTDATAFTITLEKNNERLTIKAVSPLTKYFLQITADGQPATSEISFSDIRVNDQVTAEVRLPVEGVVPASGVSGDIVANSIVVYK